MQCPTCSQPTLKPEQFILCKPTTVRGYATQKRTGVGYPVQLQAVFPGHHLVALGSLIQRGFNKGIVADGL